MKIVPLRLAVALLAALGIHAAIAGAFPNPGFENGLDGWTVREKKQQPMSAVAAEAAHGGKAGLRVNDQSTKEGSSVFSQKYSVVPGTRVGAEFWAKTGKPGFAGVYLRFYSPDGRMIDGGQQKGDAEHRFCGIDQADNEWHAYSLGATVPQEAAAMALWIHTFGSATGTADFDDFTVTGIGGPFSPAPPVRAKPAIIILKLDDFRAVSAHRTLPAQWRKVADLLETRKIKASIGIICDSLEQANDASLEWVKNLRDSGRAEFWFHGWDHKVWTDDKGVKHNELAGRSYEEQKARFDRSQKLAKEKLGFDLHAYGPPGGVGNGSFDDNTVRVMQDDPEMTVWLFPGPINEAGKKLEAKGKVTILDRVWPVNIENPLFVPNLAKLKEGYAKYPDRAYFVLQGHPTRWTPDRFEEFTKIVDFLIEQKAVFMTPSEAAASLHH